MCTAWLCVTCLFALLFANHSILAERSNHEQGGAEEVGAVCESCGFTGREFALTAAIFCRCEPLRR